MGTTVSIVLPTLNERAFIVDCLTTLVAQDYDDVVEILVVDGGSTDGTRDLAERFAPGGVKVLDNPRVTAAAAMNVGIAAAGGEVIVRADAHTLYASDYVSSCVRVLQETGADNVGGPMRPVGTTSFGRAVAAVTSSPFGVGPGRFHFSRQREEVDTVYLGCFSKATLESLGGYDEVGIQWAAEDQELNFRLRKRGGRIVLDPSIQSWYFPRETPRALARQYANYGVCKVSTLRKHGELPSWRPWAPAALVLASVLALLLGRRPAVRFGLPVVHAAATAAVATRLARQPGVSGRHAFAVLQVCHWSYGVGFWRGVFKLLSGRPFETRPGGHR